MTSDPRGMPDSPPRRVLLGELLVQSGVITQEQLAEVLGAPREPGKKIGLLLLERGYITESQLTQMLSLQLSVPWVSLYHVDFSRQLLNRVARDLADRYCLIPIFVRHVKGQGEALYVAMDDPTNEVALAEVARQAGLPARPMIASASDIRSAIRVYYGDASASQPTIEVPVPPARLEPPTTTREDRGATREAPQAAASTPVQRAARPPQPPQSVENMPAQARVPSQPPPLRAPSQPPARQEPAPAAVVIPAAAATPTVTAGSVPPDRPSDSPRGEARRRGAKMLSLTLLDGTTIKVPTAPPQKKTAGAFTPDSNLTARDFISALRASSHGADASEILGQTPHWEPVVAALLSILLRKGLIADWEFIEELRKI